VKSGAGVPDVFANAVAAAKPAARASMRNFMTPVHKCRVGQAVHTGKLKAKWMETNFFRVLTACMPPIDNSP
jgi:hypothetical protein